MRNDARHLLSSEANALRLRAAIAQLEAGNGVERELDDEYLCRLQKRIDKACEGVTFKSISRATW